MAFKKYEDLCFTDDYMFWTVMTNYEEICLQVVELCIGRRVHEIRYKEGQKSLQAAPASKGIRLDVYLEDEARTLYDIEMQNLARPFIGRRIRYYSSTMDVNYLYAGMDYEELPDLYVVFLCMFDPFGAGQVVYEFERREKTRTDLSLGDGSKALLINPFGDDSGCTPRMRSFLAYLRGEDADHGLGRQIEDAVLQVKRHEKWREGYMKYEADMMDQRREGRAEGIAEGRAAGIAEGIAEGHAKGIAESRSALCDRMIRQGLSDAQIAQIMEVPAEEIAQRRLEIG